MITGNLNVIPDAIVRNIISKGPKINFPLILISLNVVERSLLLSKISDIVCVEPDALKEWKINVLKIIDIVFHFTLVIHIVYPINLSLLFRHLKRGN